MPDNSALYGPTGELAGQAIGDLIASGNYSQIQNLLNQLKAGYANLPGGTPVTPNTVGRSALSGVTEDPNLSAAENAALAALMKEGTTGGLNDADKAKLNQAKLAALDYQHGVEGQAEQSLRRRGLYSSGAELASQLAAQQGGINANNQGDIAAAGAASTRALQALQAGGAMANSLGTRDLSQKDAAASANDRINQFNSTQGNADQQFNSGLAQQNALAKLQGIGGADASEIAMLQKLAGGAAAKGGGYGRQAGDLLGAKSGSGGALGSLSNNPYPGINSSDPNSVFSGGTNYDGGSNPSDWTNPFAGSDSYGGTPIGDNYDLQGFGADAGGAAGDASSLDDLLGMFD